MPCFFWDKDEKKIAIDYDGRNDRKRKKNMSNKLVTKIC